MSIENFCREYPPTSFIKQRLQEKRGQRPGSLIYILADELAKAGGDGLKQISRRIAAQGVTLEPDSVFMSNLSFDDRQFIWDHYSAIVFGVSIMEIETVLITKSFDPKSFCERFNFHLTGTTFPKMPITGEQEMLDELKWKSMIGCANYDKTLAAFFIQGANTLPSGLQSILNQSGGIEYIKNKIIPIYQPCAQFLVK